MSREDNDGVAYLRALRGTATDSTATAASPARESVAPGGTENSVAGPQPFAGPEKRRSPRYKCEGSAQMREEGHDVHTWATFTDISLHGCYVEATATYPVGTILDLKLAVNGFEVSAKGIVRVNYPFLGMGIALTEMSEDNRTRMKELLRTISRATIVMGAPPATSGPLENVPLTSDAPAALRALVEFFAKRQTLPREEFLRILAKSQEVGAKPE